MHSWQPTSVKTTDGEMGYNKKPSYRWGTARRGRASW